MGDDVILGFPGCRVRDRPVRFRYLLGNLVQKKLEGWGREIDLRLSFKCRLCVLPIVGRMMRIYYYQPGKTV